MANGSGNGGTPVLAFILGGALVVVVVLGLFIYSGHHGGGGTDLHVTDVTHPH